MMMYNVNVFMQIKYITDKVDIIVFAVVDRRTSKQPPEPPKNSNKRFSSGFVNYGMHSIAGKKSVKF